MWLTFRLIFQSKSEPHFFLSFTIRGIKTVEKNLLKIKEFIKERNQKKDVLSIRERI